MDRREYRLVPSLTTDTGEPCVIESEEYIQELLTPDLSRVEGPLRQTVFRYMKLEHLERCLRDRELYMPRVDQFDEPWEGSYSDAADFEGNPAYAGFTAEQRRRSEESFKRLRQSTVQKLHYVSCWNMNEKESELLWNRYYRDFDDAVAVTTTVGDLCSLRPTMVKVNDIDFIPRFAAGEVRYIDHGIPGSIPAHDVTLFYKGIEFKDDREFRIMVQLTRMGWIQHDNPHLPKGVKIPILPGVFFNSIIAKPKSRGLVDRVNAILDDVGYDIPVLVSALDRIPTW